MNILSATPAWPRRPPLWSSAALLLSLILGVFYCWATVKLMPGNQGQLFRVYANSAAWSLVPPLPSFGRHAHVQTHEFMMPDGSAFRVPPLVLYRNLRGVIYRWAFHSGAVQRSVRLLCFDIVRTPLCRPDP